LLGEVDLPFTAFAAFSHLGRSAILDLDFSALRIMKLRPQEVGITVKVI
jgi:hypothetical protein